MSTDKHFKLFDRSQPLEIAARFLPHWFQSEVAIFVTFRTADSLPKPVLQKMQQDLSAWLLERQLPEELATTLIQERTSEHQNLLANLSLADRNSIKRQISRMRDLALDNCHGACLFRRPELAEIVAQHILFFDGERYDIASFVVMPNHVHAIVQFRTGYKLNLIGQSWMRLSARRINEYMGTKGEIWQPEPFDHLIRSTNEFEYLHNYIRDNPHNAKLKAGEYYYYPPQT